MNIYTQTSHLSIFSEILYKHCVMDPSELQHQLQKPSLSWLPFWRMFTMWVSVCDGGDRINIGNAGALSFLFDI